MSEAKIEAYFFTAFFVGMLGVVGIMFFPFTGALATAIVLATLAYPLFEHLERWLRRPNLSAGIVTLFVTLAILLPALGVFTILLAEVQGISQTLASVGLNVLPDGLKSIIENVVTALPFLASVNVSLIIQHAVESAGNQVGSAIAGTADVFLKIFVTILALFYFLRDGRRFLQGFIDISPLSDDEDVLIVKKLKTVSISLIRGTLVIAILQGILTGIGFLLFGLPNPVLWGSVAMICSIVPMVGIGLVNAPAAIFLFVTGHYTLGIGFVLWAALVPGTIDNILGPKIIGTGARIHPLFVLLSVIGGLVLFGATGFLVGPLLFGLLVALLDIYTFKIKELHMRTL